MYSFFDILPGRLQDMVEVLHEFPLLHLVIDKSYASCAFHLDILNKHSLYNRYSKVDTVVVHENDIVWRTTY
jgi:hypothetical protein